MADYPGEELPEVTVEQGSAAPSDGEDLMSGSGGGAVVIPVPSGLDGGL